jgi:hypothetical protein
MSVLRLVWPLTIWHATCCHYEWQASSHYFSMNQLNARTIATGL